MFALNELTIGPEEFDATRLLSHWEWRVPQSFRPLFLSLFGDWFFRDSSDQVHMLDLVAGKLKPIADSYELFDAFLTLDEYQRDWLMSELVEQLRQSGVTRDRAQCFAFRTPPILGGEISPANIVVWDLAAYQSGTSKIHQQVAGSPSGTRFM